MPRRSLPAILAIVLLGAIGIQVAALPAHDAQHSLQQAKRGNDATPVIVKGQCDLCLAYASNAATDNFAPPTVDPTPISTSLPVSLVRSPSTDRLVPYARGP